MLESAKFSKKEIYEAISGLHRLHEIIVPLLKKINFEGIGEKDAEEFKLHLMMAKHALLLIGNLLEIQTEPAF